MLGLLTQTHVLAAALSFSLSAAWLLETVFEWRTARQNEMGKQGAAVWGGLGISLLSGLFLVWELAGSIGNNASVHVRVSSSLGANLRQMGEGDLESLKKKHLLLKYLFNLLKVLLSFDLKFHYYSNEIHLFLE